MRTSDRRRSNVAGHRTTMDVAGRRTQGYAATPPTSGRLHLTQPLLKTTTLPQPGSVDPRIGTDPR